MMARVDCCRLPRLWICQNAVGFQDELSLAVQIMASLALRLISRRAQLRRIDPVIQWWEVHYLADCLLTTLDKHALPLPIWLRRSGVSGVWASACAGRRPLNRQAIFSAQKGYLVTFLTYIAAGRFHKNLALNCLVWRKSSTMVSTQNDGAATALAVIGTVCWCIQLIPQLIRNWYVRDCEGVPPLMFFLFAVSGTPFAIYFVDQTANTALMVQPYLFTFFSFVGFWQSLYYPPVAYSAAKCWLILAATVGASVGIQLGCIIPLRHLYNKGTEWPNLIPGVVAVVLLGVGLLPPYWELLKRRGRVVGINFLFLILDSSGAVFSTAAVAIQPGKLDILGLVLYIVVMALEYGIMLSHIIWTVRVRYLKLSTEQSGDTEAWKILKAEKSYPPKTELLRHWLSKSIVDPLKHRVINFGLRHNHDPERRSQEGISSRSSSS